MYEYMHSYEGPGDGRDVRRSGRDRRRRVRPAQRHAPPRERGRTQHHAHAAVGWPRAAHAHPTSARAWVARGYRPRGPRGPVGPVPPLGGPYPPALINPYAGPYAGPYWPHGAPGREGILDRQGRADRPDPDGGQGVGVVPGTARAAARHRRREDRPRQTPPRTATRSRAPRSEPGPNPGLLRAGRAGVAAVRGRRGASDGVVPDQHARVPRTERDRAARRAAAADRV